MGATLEIGAGIHLHAGKTCIWNRAGIPPPDIDYLGEEVWSPGGVKVLLSNAHDSCCCNARAPFPISQVRSRIRRSDVPDDDGIVGHPSRQSTIDCDSTGHHHGSNEI